MNMTETCKLTHIADIFKITRIKWFHIKTDTEGMKKKEMT